MKELEALEAGRARKIVLGVSGGVASAVAAALLKNQGFEVLGVFLDIGSERAEDREFAEKHSRCAATAYESAASICKRLDVPLSRMDVRGLYEDRVLDRFLHERLRGGQGSPCLRCHSEVKVASLLARADELGIEKVATGHYAQVIQDVTSGDIRLHKATDATVDQSQLLFRLDQARLKRLIMPLGGIPYSMVAKLAAEFQLDSAPVPRVADGACFMGASTLADFVERRVAPSLRPSGTVKTSDGHSVGEHEGVFAFEVGRKPGLQLAIAEPERYVVVEVNAADNAVVVGSREGLSHQRFSASEANWLQPMDRLHDLRCIARVEGAPSEVECRVIHFENEVVHVELDQQREGIAPGRAVAFYSGTELLGGATIEQVFPDEAPSGGR